MKYPKKIFTEAQIAWCKNYENETTFEPLMDDFIAGNQTFQEAAESSIHWFESWSSDALLQCDNNYLVNAWADEEEQEG